MEHMRHIGDLLCLVERFQNHLTVFKVIYAVLLQIWIHHKLHANVSEWNSIHANSFTFSWYYIGCYKWIYLLLDGLEKQIFALPTLCPSTLPFNLVPTLGTFLWIWEHSIFIVFFYYETLQACASISVQKLCNFHLPYLVNFVRKKTNIMFFSPKYLGLPFLIKYLVNKKSVWILRKVWIFVIST